MALPMSSSDRTLFIYLSLAQYPILSIQIRARMRRELFARGVISQVAFESEVREKAIHSQELEGLHNPFFEEPADIWEARLTRVREHLTDFYFAYNLPNELFEKIVRETLSERGAGLSHIEFSFNPELAPQDLLFEQAESIENMPPHERIKQEARLQEIKVVLIRTMISDQLAYIKIAKKWLTIADLSEIRIHKIGQGKIGGKSAGMLLAARILRECADDDIRSSLRLPESYFLGADLTYTFMALNGLMPWIDQKYKTETEIHSDYPRIQEEFQLGKFPEDILDKFRELLAEVGPRPLIVRSSSLLEDNFGTSFAGKYESYFLPNQGTAEGNLQEFTAAVIRIYASMLNPDALLYRRARGLQDYDERMAILIQVVQGERHGRYFFPFAAGVAFSENVYRWSPQIRREDGFVRLVWGLGTRAVDRVGNDYPRIVALSHPLLYPAASAKSIRSYSQQFIDLIDLEDNTFKTIPVKEALSTHLPQLRYLVQIDQGDYLSPLRLMAGENSSQEYVLTFDELLRRTPMVKRLSKMLQILQEHYLAPVDVEFTIRLENPESTTPKVEFTLLQCRPQSQLKQNQARLPRDLSADDIIFSTSRMAPEGRVENIKYVLFVQPEGYFSLPTAVERSRVGSDISLLNAALRGEVFICLGPGRWGTSSPDLGVQIGFGDIYHTRALVELTGRFLGYAPEPSFGTHFFQDLVESNIYPLAVDLEDQDTVFNHAFFYDTPNMLAKIAPKLANEETCLRLICVADYRPGAHLELVMDDHAGKSVAYLKEAI